MALSGIVTFTTDFGLADGFVAQMKGVALSIQRDLTFVDITHDVPPHDIVAGALRLRAAFDTFPSGTVHVAVVDPGVGSERRGIVVRTAGHHFIGPDNGVLSLALDKAGAGDAHVLEATHLRRETVSPTFEGRDVFAPAAAWIVRGLEPDRFGPPAGEIETLRLPRVELRPGASARARVLDVDRFGNVALSVTAADLRTSETAHGDVSLQVRTAAGEVVDRLVRTYADAEPGAAVVLVNSADFLELAVREGRAADRLGLAPGDEVEVSLAADARVL